MKKRILFLITLLFANISTQAMTSMASNLVAIMRTIIPARTLSTTTKQVVKKNVIPEYTGGSFGYASLMLGGYQPELAKEYEAQEIEFFRNQHSKIDPILFAPDLKSLEFLPDADRKSYIIQKADNRIQIFKKNDPENRSAVDFDADLSFTLNNAREYLSKKSAIQGRYREVAQIYSKMEKSAMEKYIVEYYLPMLLTTENIIEAEQFKNQAFGD